MHPLYETRLSEVLPVFSLCLGGEGNAKRGRDLQVTDQKSQVQLAVKKKSIELDSEVTSEVVTSEAEDIEKQDKEDTKVDKLADSDDGVDEGTGTILQ